MSKMVEGAGTTNSQGSIPAPVGGLNAVDSPAAMPITDALVAENVVCYPDRVEMRFGVANHVTGFAKPVKGLWSWNGPTANTLWATTDDGIFNATTAGAVGAAAIALTSGQTVAATLATGAGTYLNIVNGVDTLKQYNGAVWAAVAAFGGLNTANISAIETYKQRLYCLEKNTLNLWYLPVNSVVGAATSYPLGAIFRRGGSLMSIATWTIDGGNGPDDMLVVSTSSGELAVFSGTDPSAAATWSLKGVYYIGRPIGTLSLYKYQGDLLYLSEGGILPLAKALQTANVDRSVAFTQKIKPLFAEYITSYGTVSGWQIISHPDIPFLLVNVPGTANGTQLVMHAQTGAWSSFDGWKANCWERIGSQLYFGGATFVAKAWNGSSDFGNNIVSTCFGAFSRLGYPRNKDVRQVRAAFQSNGAFSYTLGVANDFSMIPNTSIVAGSGSSSLWGTGVWGTAVWTSSNILTREWRTVPDVSGVYKALYFQISSKSSRVALISADYLYVRGGTFG